AGETGGCPLGRSAYIVASSSWNGTSKIWWRCSRKKTNSLARRTRRTMVCSAGDRATGGCQIAGRIGHSLDSPLLILPAYATVATLPRPLADYSTGALVQLGVSFILLVGAPLVGALGDLNEGTHK